MSDGILLIGGYVETWMFDVMLCRSVQIRYLVMSEGRCLMSCYVGLYIFDLL